MSECSITNEVPYERRKFMEANLAAVQILKQDSVRISLVEQPKDESITIKYHTLNNNQPDANGNYIGLWQSDDGIIPAERAIDAVPVCSKKTSANYTFNMQIGDNSYVLGYCQTGNPVKDLSACTNVSACAKIEPTESDMTYMDHATLGIKGRTDSVTVTYNLLKHTRHDSHWIGIWKENMDIGTDMPMYKVQVPNADPNKSGEIILNGVPFSRGTSYTLAYFVAGYCDCNVDVSSMLAYIEFQF